ncbi:hypothetical protein [Vibrio alginolyticus]|uniref:hypothetical protein n=1 Tax=Vibrio alginolyticus TaxID=663 RepID=UPI001BD4EE54|nr:hypothetical protein [Vibrio alginolyticus]ELB2885421.1 hypothetical protein [Vibrio alginolyticus]MBS9861428.1 hypothetical protein [Vibrio alginolyticus]
MSVSPIGDMPLSPEYEKVIHARLYENMTQPDAYSLCYSRDEGNASVFFNRPDVQERMKYLQTQMSDQIQTQFIQNLNKILSESTEALSFATFKDKDVETITSTMLKAAQTLKALGITQEKTEAEVTLNDQRQNARDAFLETLTDMGIIAPSGEPDASQ